jgi:hypothetical protein
MRIAVAACVFLSGCELAVVLIRQQRIDDQMKTWLNHPIGEAISAWGAPTNTAQTGPASGVVEWDYPDCRKWFDVSRGTITGWHRQGC